MDPIQQKMSFIFRKVDSFLQPAKSAAAQRSHVLREFAAGNLVSPKHVFVKV